jgi:hypothetical protein
VLLLLSLVGCVGPDITYGERAVLRPKPAVMNEGGVGGASAMAGASGTPGVIEPPPDDVPPDNAPVPMDDAGAADASIPIEPIDAGMEAELEPEAELACEIPFELLEATTVGHGEESGCAQMVCGGNATITTLDLNGLDIALGAYDPSERRGCTTVFGDLVVHNYFGKDLSALSCLEMITGSLLILGAPELESLDGVDNLRYVGGDVSIGHGTSYATDVSALADISGLAQLRVMLGTLTIAAPVLVSLRGLERLAAIGGSFELGAVAALYDLTGLAGLRAIGDDFVISGASGLRGFSGADGLELIGGSFEFAGSQNLRAFDGALASVRCISGRVAIEGPNPALEELDLFPALRKIGGDVVVHDNEQLHSITMLSHVQDIGGSLAIQGNRALAQVDLSSLEELGGVMWVLDNPKLEECPLVELAGALGRTDGSQISDNARILSTECSALQP